MSKTYKVYHNDQWIDATFIRAAGEDRVWLEYDHVEDDEDGQQKPAVKRQINVTENDVSVKVIETE
jgi:hypothetical protein